MNIQLIEFKKPTHWKDNTCWINLSVDKVKEAKKKKLKIVVKLPEGYCKPKDPSNLLKYGKKTEAVYLYPDNPMKLVGAYYEPFDKDNQERIKQDPSFWYYL